MKKYLYALLLNILSVISVTAQTQIINGIPRDTSYTVYNSYIKESKRFPFIKTVDTVIPPGIESFSDIVSKKSRELNMAAGN